MDLLPLALQALADREARQVLSDAVQESRWRDDRVYTRRWFTKPRRQGFFRIRPPWGVGVWPRAFMLRAWSRAVAAVLLFGEWSTERWPVNWTPERLGGLEAWIPGTTTITGIDRAAGTIQYNGSPPSFAGVERTGRGEYTVTLATPEDAVRFEPGGLARLWSSETEAAMERVRRDIDSAGARLRERELWRQRRRNG